MEKCCKSCGRVFDDLNFKICPYCGGKLATRYGRQPIPRKLRHEVFKRDGYRCRECGASKDETSLEIDHIVPVAKGGTNDIDNLQTLCRECNRMKYTDTWVGGETDLEVAQNELINLEIQLQDAKNGLKNAVTDDDEIEYQFMIIKLNERIVDIKNKIESLKKRIEVEKEKKKDNKRKDKLFKKLYVKLDEESLELLSKYYKINYENKDDLIRYLVNNYTEYDINAILLNRETIELYEKLYSIWDKETIGLASRYLETNSSNKGVVIRSIIEYLHTEEAINRAIRGQRKKEEYFNNNPTKTSG